MCADPVDENASASVTILEAFRNLSMNKTTATGEVSNTIELRWYAANSNRLRGFMSVFQKYDHKRRGVVAMLNQDQTATLEVTIPPINLRLVSC